MQIRYMNLYDGDVSLSEGAHFLLVLKGIILIILVGILLGLSYLSHLLIILSDSHIPEEKGGTIESKQPSMHCFAVC